MDGDTVTVENPFFDIIDRVSIEEIGYSEVGDILSTETGGWLFLREEELTDLTEEYRGIFREYLKAKGFSLLY